MTETDSAFPPSRHHHQAHTSGASSLSAGEPNQMKTSGKTWDSLPKGSNKKNIVGKPGHPDLLEKCRPFTDTLPSSKLKHHDDIH